MKRFTGFAKRGTGCLPDDYRFRTIVLTCPALALNLIYAFLNGFYGVRFHSVWFGSLSVYYMVLGIMRFLIINYERMIRNENCSERKRQKENSVYRICGLLLMLVTAALTVVVFLLGYSSIEKSYPGFMIYAVATYSFYKITMSVINLVKVRKLNSPLLSSIRNIGYADALVSILSLQVAMFTSFGNVSEMQVKIFHLLTGTCVCLMILLMAVFMIRGHKDNI